MTEREHELRAIKATLRAFPLVRSESWLAFIRTQPCIFCGVGPELVKIDPHHICGGYHGTKSSDLLTIPACRKCHQEKGENLVYFDTELVSLCRIWHTFIAGVNCTHLD